MKKTLILIIAALATLSLTSCHKQDVYAGCEMQTIIVNVSQNSWAYTNVDNNNYFYATIDMPEFTEDVFDRGLVKVYRVYNFDTVEASQIELPYVRPMERTLDGGKTWEFYTEMVDYEYGIGKMTVFFTMSNFDYEIDETMMPEKMQFRCVIAY